MLDYSTIIYTDLDGTLLDHDTYSFEPAIETLQELETLGVPVIITTSKTKREVEGLIRELSLWYSWAPQMPIIIENGAAVYFPNQAPYPGKGLSLDGDSLYQSFSPNRQELQAFIESHLGAWSHYFKTFSDLGCEGIAEATGLEAEQAELANQRGFSEPVLWLGSEPAKGAFMGKVESKGMTVLEGGRFLHITSGYDKGKAVAWTTNFLSRVNDMPEIKTVALGDGGNDRAMLELVDYPVVIKNSKGEHVEFQSVGKNAILTTKKGPSGWAEAIEKLSTAGVFR